MEIQIQNESLSVSVDTLGAQLRHIVSADGTEYLWQGDSRYWTDQAPTLFPFIGRLWKESCTYEGNRFSMGIHGFASGSEFHPVLQEKDRLILELCDSAETRSRYPVAFSLQICFALAGNQLRVSYRVENRDRKCMAFAVGGHPGFRVPLEAGESFEDYTLRFAHPCHPDRIGFSGEVLVSGKDEAYRLQKDQEIPLRHDLFDEDAIILKNMDREILLSSRKSGRSVRVSYEDFPYLGIWHMPHMDAPYVCIEPWTSLPGRQDVVEEFTQKSDMIRLHPGKIWENSWTVSIT